MKTRLVRVARLTLAIGAMAYPIALIAVWLLMRFVGERWWLTTVLLYLPRAGWALPLPLFTLALLFAFRKRWLLTQLVAAVVVILPLMGLRFSSRGTAPAGAATLRVVSLNTGSDRFGARGLAAQLAAARPDLIVLQEARVDDRAALQALLPDFHIELRDQFLAASRYPIELQPTPAMIEVGGVRRDPFFLSFDWLVPAGRIRVYDVHPISPRDGLENLRWRGLHDNLARGRFIERRLSDQVALNAELRVRSLEAVVENARQAGLPVLIAGDTNLPDGSWALARILGRYQDGFLEVGRGFGYTFPAIKRAWMRIDRVLADGHFRFLDFAVLEPRVSDHLAVQADLAFSGGRPAPK